MFRRILFAALFLPALAAAQPPPGPIDPDIHEWFENLIRADGVHCCSESDCRVAAPGEVKYGANGFEVLMDGAWIPVPDGYIVHRETNPLAATIVCKTTYTSLPSTLYCLVPFNGG